jgi:DNA-binding transcriptional LysR family regulator
MLEEGSLDLGFLRMPFVGGPRVEVIPIHPEPFVMVVPSSHRLARKSAVRLRETPNETYVLYERAHAPGFHDLVLGILNRARVVPEVFQVAGEMPTLICLIASGAGISLLPVSAVKITRAAVVGCEILDKIPISEVAMACLKTPSTAVVEHFKKFVLANARANWRPANSSEKPRG